MLRNFGLAFVAWTLLGWASSLKGHGFELACAFLAGVELGGPSCCETIVAVNLCSCTTHSESFGRVGVDAATAHTMASHNSARASGCNSL